MGTVLHFDSLLDAARFSRKLFPNLADHPIKALQSSQFVQEIPPERNASLVNIMINAMHVAGSREDIRRYVLETFCSRFDLDPRYFAVNEKPLFRQRRQTGILYSVEGPRRLRFWAVWDWNEHKILFYGLDGQRFQTTELLYAEMPMLRAA
jgi:hypothetical protein